MKQVLVETSTHAAYLHEPQKVTREILLDQTNPTVSVEQAKALESCLRDVEWCDACFEGDDVHGRDRPEIESQKAGMDL